MNVLLYQYGSICEPDIIAGLQELGFHVDTITDEITDKEITSKEQLTLVDHALQQKDYTFIFTINFFPVISEICNIYHIPYLSFIVDSPVLELHSDSIQNSWNRIFLFDRMLYEEFSPYNPDCIFHLPLATNTERWDHTIRQASGRERKQFSSELSFVGSLYTEKCPYYDLHFPSDYLRGYTEGLLNAQKHIYGYYLIDEALDAQFVNDLLAVNPDIYQFPEKARHDYKAVISQFYFGPRITEMERRELLTTLGRRFPVHLYSASDASDLPVHAHGTVNTHTQMPLIFHHSQINLNITAKSIRSGLSLRIWDILGCQGFLISNYQSEIPDYFTPDEDLVMYSSKEELLELTSYYLAHPEKCREIAKNAYEKIKQYHTYPVRLSQMIELAFFQN